MSCWPGCGLWWRRRTLRTRCCGRSWTLPWERYRRLELRVAELERRLGQDSTNSGTPTSKEPIGAKERRKAGRRQRQESERERRQDRKPGGQPGYRGAGLSRDPDPQERKSADPPAQCSRCGTGQADAEPADRSWAQVWDVKISRFVTEHLLPALRCPVAGKSPPRRPRPARTQAASPTAQRLTRPRCCCPGTGTCLPNGPRT